MSGHACNGGPDDCALRRAWGAYDADRWIRSLPAGVFPGTMYQEPTPKPTERCEACPMSEDTTQPEATGDCYEAAARAVIDHDQWLLVHGIVQGYGPLEGRRFGHAWIELPDVPWVFEVANGRRAVIDKDLYYKVGKPTDLVRYTWEEACKLMLQTGHYGPWDERFKEVA